jgi:hypothetical protein
LDFPICHNNSETVEKVPKQILGGDTGKNDLTESATINDLTIMRGHKTPQNHPPTILKGFSTGSAALGNLGNEVFTFSG